MSRKESDRYSVLPVDGLPLDLVVSISQCAPERIANICAFIEEIRGKDSRGRFVSYEPADIERIRARLKEPCGPEW
jgi:hypothetical protein